ncbi:hypothetical protein PRIC2_013516 [Phytophthora ramorum]
MSSSSERKLRQTCASCFSVGCAPGTPINGWSILLAVPCGHVFCKPCVAKRCAVGLTDRSLVPAHCCGLEFLIEYVKDALQPSAFATYSLFLAERQWKTTNLRSDVEYAAMVRSVGGMQCPNCGVGITKISGCEHMQCLCGSMSGDAFVVVFLKPEIATGYFNFTASGDQPEDDDGTAAPSSSIPGVSPVEAAYLLPNGHIIPTILSRIKDKGLEVVQRRMKHFTRAEVRNLFSFELQQRFHDDEHAFATFLTAVTKGPSLALLLKLPGAGDANAAIKKWSELAGDWDPVVARKKALAASVPHDQWPLRALCGLNAIQNGIASSSHACCTHRERFFLFPPAAPQLERATIVLLPSFYSNFPAGKDILLSTIGKETRAIVVENKEGCSLSGEEALVLCGLTRSFDEGPVDQACVSVVELMDQTVGAKGVDILVLEGLDLSYTLRSAVGPANVELARLYYRDSVRGQMSSKIPSVELPAALQTADNDTLGFESGLFLSFDSRLHLGKASDEALAGSPQIGPAVEVTLGLIKPNAACKPDVVADIMRMINLFGFTVERQRRLELSRDQADAFYAEHRGKAFFETLLGFMTSGEIVALELSRPHAIKAWRALMGPTNSISARETHPWTLRARFGVDGTRNATHGSDASTSAAREVCFFFGNALSASSAASKQPNGAVLSGKAAQRPMAVSGASDSSIEKVLTQGLKELLEKKLPDPLQACRWLGEWLVAYRVRGLEEESGVLQGAQQPARGLKPDLSVKRVSEEATACRRRKVVAMTLEAAVSDAVRTTLLDTLRERLRDARYQLVDVATELKKFAALDSGVASLVKTLKEGGRRRCVLFGCEELAQSSGFHREFKTHAPPDWQINFVVHVELQKNDVGTTRQSSSLDVPVLQVVLPSTSTVNPQELRAKDGALQGLFHAVFDPNIVLVEDQERLVPSTVWTEVAKHYGFSLLTFDTFVASVKTSNDDSSETQLLLSLLRSGSNVPSTLLLTVLRRVVLGTQPGSSTITQKFMLLGFPWSEIQASELEQAIGRPQSVLFVSENSQRVVPAWMHAFRKKGLVKRVWIDSSSRVDCNAVRSELCGALGPVIGCFLGKCEANEQLQLLQAVAKAQGFVWIDCSLLNMPTPQRLRDLLLQPHTGREKFFLYGYPQTRAQAEEFLNVAAAPQFVIHNSSSVLPVAQEVLAVLDAHPSIMQLDLASSQTSNGSSKLPSIFFRKQVVVVVGSVSTLHLPQLRDVVSPLGYDVLDLRHDEGVHQKDDELAGVRELERRVQAVQAPRCLVVGAPHSPSFYHALEARVGCAIHKLLILQHVPVRARATDDGDSDDYSDEEQGHVHVDESGSDGDDNAMSTRDAIKSRKAMQTLSSDLAQLLQTLAASSTSSISVEVLGFLENAPVGSSRVVQDVVARLRPRLFGVVGHPFSFYQAAARCFCRRHFVGFVDLSTMSSSLQALRALETLVATTPHAVYCLDGFPRSSLPDATVSSTAASPPRYVAQQLWELDRRVGALTTLVHFTTALEVLEERTPEQVTRRMLAMAQDDLELASADLIRWFTTGKNRRQTISEVTCDRTLEDTQEELDCVLQRALRPSRPAVKQTGG